MINSITALFTLMNLPFFVTMATPSPEVVIPGNPSILVLFDFHQRMNSSGSCSDFRPRSVELLWSMRWLNDVTLRNDPDSHLGMIVFDTCGSVRRSIQILSQYLSNDDCQNRSTISGIITYTAPAVRSAVSEISKPMVLLYTDISESDFITSGQRSSLTIATISIWKIQATIELIQKLKWNFMDILSSNRTSSIALSSMFIEMAEKYSVCLTSSQIVSKESFNIDAMSKNPIIFFVSNDDPVDAILSDLNSTGRFVLVIGAQNRDSAPTNFSNIIFLKEKLPGLESLTNYTIRQIDDIPLNGTEISTQSYLSLLPFCERNDTSQGILCSRNDLQTFLAGRMKGRDIFAALTALYNVETIQRRAKLLKCEGLDYTQCPNAFQYSVVKMDQPTRGYPLNTFDLSNGAAQMEQTTSILYLPWNNTGKIVEMNNTTLKVQHDTVWKKLHYANYNMSCGKTYTICRKYFPKTNQSNNNLIMSKPGDILIGGLFPIHERSKLGESCGTLSWEGLQMAEALVYAIHRINSQYLTLFPNVSLGFVIADSCGSSVYMDQYQTKSCSGEGTESINLCKAVTMVEYVSNRDVLTFKPPSALPTFVASSLGVTYDGIVYQRYIQDSIDLLVSLNWTYINIVYSEYQATNEVFIRSLRSFKENNICFANSIVVKADKASLEKDVASLYLPSLKSGAFVILASYDDAKNVLDILSSRQNSFSDLNVLTFPWNSIMTPHPGLVEIKLKPVIDSDFVAYVNGLDIKNNKQNPWWVEFHEEMHRCSVSVREGMIYPTLCNNIPTATADFENSPKATVIMQAVESAIIPLAKVYKELCPLQNGICENFRKSSTLKQQISEATNSPKLLNSGGSMATTYWNLKMTKDIINYHIQNSTLVPIKVGEFTKDNVLTVDNDLVKLYSSENKSYVTIHKCHDWCPECYACATSIPKQEVEFKYTPGDVVIAGMFPIHEKGSNPFSCGEFTITKGTEHLIEAFMYAISTVKNRYPYLLPNVKVGSLVLDTCSDSDKIVQNLFNFETCTASITDSSLVLGPKLVSAYINFDEESVANDIDAVVERFNKMSFSLNTDPVSQSGSVISQLYSPYSVTGLQTLVSVLVNMNWTYVDLVISTDSAEMEKAFLDIVNTFGVCVSSITEVNTDEQSTITTAVNKLRTSFPSVVVILSMEKEVRNFFETQVARPLPKTFVIGEIGKHWIQTGDVALPSGSIVIDRDGKVNTDFKMYFDDVMMQRKTGVGNPWLQQFLIARDICRSGNQQCEPPSDILIDASRIIFGVDVVLHALHNKYINQCPQQKGLCQAFGKQGAAIRDEAFANITFDYMSSIKAHYPVEGDDPGTYIVRNFQTNGLVEVGRMTDGFMKLYPEKIQSYGSSGIKLGSPRISRCYGGCNCIGNNQSFTNDTEDTIILPGNMDLVFYNTTGKLNNELWIMVVISVAAGGTVVTLGILFFVIYKVCAGVLMKRYIGLGIFLLFSIMFLYLSVLPFAFTPNDTICAARHFVPGLAYVICFATILTKLMNLRAYKLIGLGGEISNINQFLTILFITGVQVSIGVQYLSLKKNVFQTRTDINGVVQYACMFDSEEFVTYLVYAMFLVVLCAFYSICVRKEKKNMGEAKLILIFCWLSILVWTAWIIVLFIQPRDFTEPTICVGMITIATLMVIIVFLPKLHKIARLKYDVKKSGTENGGYKIDPDFMFERPYTLPAASRTSFKYSEKTHPRSIAGFDTSLSY